MEFVHTSTGMQLWGFGGVYVREGERERASTRASKRYLGIREEEVAKSQSRGQDETLSLLDMIRQQLGLLI